MSSLEGGSLKSPDRIAHLYAILQSTQKGANLLRQGPLLVNRSPSFFNEHMKMSHDQTKKLSLVHEELQKLQSGSALKNKDSLSRLSDTIDLIRSQKHLRALESPN